jgi:hypothetical protein
MTSLPFLKKYPQVCATGAEANAAAPDPQSSTATATANVQLSPRRDHVQRGRGARNTPRSGTACGERARDGAIIG